MSAAAVLAAVLVSWTVARVAAGATGSTLEVADLAGPRRFGYHRDRRGVGGPAKQAGPRTGSRCGGLSVLRGGARRVRTLPGPVVCRSRVRSSDQSDRGDLEQVGPGAGGARRRRSAPGHEEGVLRARLAAARAPRRRRLQAVCEDGRRDGAIGVVRGVGVLGAHAAAPPPGIDPADAARAVPALTPPKAE